MEGLGVGQDGEESQDPHGRAVLLVLLPVAFLGAAYFLFIEYVLRDAIAARVRASG